MQSVNVTLLGELCKAVGDDCPTVITRVMEEFNPYFADVKLVSIDVIEIAAQIYRKRAVGHP